MTLELKVKRLSDTAILPVRATAGAAGYDLASAHSIIVPARGKQIIPTDLAIALPEGVYGRVAPRSGLAWKSHIDVGAGVIDRDYRGNVGVILFNHGEADLHIKAGDRVAQLILECIAIANVVDVGKADLPPTVRGTGAFGSTGTESLTSEEKKEPAAERSTGST